MSRKAIFVECSVPFWIDVAYQLQSTDDWEPCYWTGDPRFEPQVHRRFPDAVFHNNLDAIRGIPAAACRMLSLPVLDQPLLEELASCQMISLQMMNRMDRNDSFSFSERELLFKQYLRYWSAVLDHFSPEVVVFPVSPHLVYDYVLYSLCKRKKIQTILFEQTSLDGWIYPESRFEDGSLVLRDRYWQLCHSWDTGSLKTIPITEEAAAYLERVSGDYAGAVPFYMKDQFAQHNLVTYLGKKLLLHPNDIPLMIQKGRNLLSRSHYIKQHGKSIQDSDMKGFEYVFCKLEGMKKKNRLKQHYQSLEKPAEFKHPYFYFPLHYQPENTSCPLGEAFVDQFLIVDMLSRFAPAGWKIYVKEHSSQWHPKLHGECSRSSEFYDRVAALPNVQIIPVTTPNFELIDHAKAVVTITGTAGWEAVVRGRPVLLYGHAWYKFCKGVFYVPSVEKCKKALATIQEGYTINPTHVRLFISAVLEVGTNAYVEPSYAKIVNISPADNISRLTSAIQSFFASNQGSTH
ncbi:MAG TPA: hypothetical protein VMT57_03480 [Candidatus Thermoplasmatota archaeon]|nr:hypothetical protein [Candidatus Thermoplasmatota archaeon]